MVWLHMTGSAADQKRGGIHRGCGTKRFMKCSIATRSNNEAFVEGLLFAMHDYGTGVVATAGSKQLT
jgi:hypothetical protein